MTTTQQQRKPVYKIGDQVVIKSGGPTMTVEKPVYNVDRAFVGTYKCQWFAGKKLDFGTFPEASLDPYIPKP
ncbi:TPA: DUF2158 domain-containing protein [Serratia marcescens]|nr:DUF2158 domain-containing protein [Serratia marcescens]